jgi:two-component system CheB/CheR fusion protein
MAVVFVQHLAPQHESALPMLLGSVTPLPVVQVTEGMRVEANRVYVIPPNAQLEISDGELHLSVRPRDRTQYNPIDVFLRSLAESAGAQAIAVILSGTASDGAAGVRDVKAAGGFAIAQSPESAKYDGMPRAAIGTGLVDLILTPAEIAAELVQIAHQPYIREAPAIDLEGESPAPEEVPGLADDDLQKVLAHLRSVSGVDFRQYKPPTILRRLQRRMALHKINQIPSYLQYMSENPAEVQQLYQDVLIHVTRFFREPDSFEALRAQVFPEILARRNGEAPIRFWVCGCATGEEAYSVAIALLEYLEEQRKTVPIQIFATDVSDAAIEQARNGTYPDGIMSDVSPERIKRFFTRVDSTFRINKSVRDLCVFARQDLTRDPPFSKLDLIVCRNVLIYMTTALQRRLMGMFHYALKPTGFLMLGHAETIGSRADLFRVTEKRHRLYSKKETDVAPPVSFPIDFASLPSPRPERGLVAARDEGPTIQKESNRILLDRYAPPGVVVDPELQIVQFRGQTGPYLEPAPGDPSLSLLKMAREGLLYGLRSALSTARKRNAIVHRDGLRVRSNGGWRDVSLEVIPLPISGRTHYLVLFEDRARVRSSNRSEPEPETKTRGARRARAGNGRVTRLQQELAASREYLQSIIQELEAANEELQSANEEILSSNEELQSTNEELDTAKEELQSTNEELNTVNEELHGRNDELSRANSDLLNLLGNVEIAVVIVASDMRIRRFTPMAERVLNLIPADIGRPITHIKPNIDCPDLETLISNAIDRVVGQERDVQDRQGRWYSLRIRPYKNVDNRIDGAVLTLFDGESSRRQQLNGRMAADSAKVVAEMAQLPLLMLDRDLRVLAASRSFGERFGMPSDLEGRSLFELANGSWDDSVLRAALASAANGAHVEGVEVVLQSSGEGPKRERISARSINDDPSSPLLLVFDALASSPAGEE